MHKACFNQKMKHEHRTKLQLFLERNLNINLKVATS